MHIKCELIVKIIEYLVPKYVNLGAAVYSHTIL